jgi:CO dehydrogenase maturation factor
MNETKQKKIIAVCGKGGVGKTSVSAIITKILVENKKDKILAIDADPAVGLATALGFNAQKTVDDIGNSLINNVGGISKGNKKEIVLSLGYEIFEALEERGNLAFLAIGRPEQEGCYCNVNSMLKDAIDPLIKDFDFVVIDGEAGIEQVNRRVLRKVTHLFLVSDASAKGLHVVRTIKQVADKAINFETAGFILNRIRSEDNKNKFSIPEGLPLWGIIPEDDVIRAMDIAGNTIFDISAPPVENKIRKILEDLSFL